MLRSRALLTSILGCLLSHSLIGAQTPANSSRITHDCHVYAVNLAEAKKLWNDLVTRPNAKPEDLKDAARKAEMILGRFKAEVGEEIATTKSFPLPGTDLTVTATVFYTDEMMASAESMLEALVISKHPISNALVAPGASISQVNYDEHASKLLVKQVTEIKDKPWIIGLECQCMSDEERRKQMTRPAARD